MPTRREEIDRWQRRLEEVFSYQGTIGGRWLPIIFDLEKECGNDAIFSYRGYRVLSDSFMDFFADTLAKATDQIQTSGQPNEMPYYAPCLATFLTVFRGVRASEILATSGYPLYGYALQRDLKDQALALGAIANGLMSFPMFLGYHGLPDDRNWTDEERLIVYRNRMKAERIIKQTMIGEKSGLPSEHIKELAFWNRLFHLQVHGSRFTYYLDSGGWIFNPQKLFSLGPLPSKDACVMFMNRSVEISWMILRSLPFVQLPEHLFDGDWPERWSVLDESFRFSVEGLADSGKRIGSAFICLIENKFAFSPKTYYCERASD